MKPEPLMFPRGIRFPRIDEIPPGAPADAATRIAEAERTLITTGYVRIECDDARGCTTLLEANVHAPDLWSVFSDLVEALLPPAAAPIIGITHEEPVLGDYTTREASLTVLAPYADMLVNDGFLEFGCIFQRAGCTEEVFVPRAKFIRVWTSHPERAIAVFERRGIPQMPNLRFVDDFPLVCEAQHYGGTDSGWYVVVEELRDKFRSLPEPPSDYQVT